MNETNKCTSCHSICWGCAVAAGVIATIIMTVVMYFEGLNIMKLLGVMLMGSDAGIGAQYLAGGVLHFVIGIFYGIVYAVLFGCLKMHTFFKALIFGAIITVIAFFGMPIMADMLSNEEGMNPCNPCSMSMGGQYNPCNPCNPCGEVVVEEVDVVVVNPCALEQEEEALAWDVLLLSFVNHLIFAFSLAFLYRMRKNK